MLLDVFPITATYSNAVVAFMLTNTTELVTKLDLPVPVPVTRASVERIVVDPRTGSVGGVLWLTSGYKFFFQFAKADSMDSPHSYFILQDPDEIPRFFGTIRMTTNEVVALARRTVRQVGYQLSWVEDVEPKITLAGVAPSDRPKVVPHYRVEWNHRTPDRGLELTARVEVNADAKRVEQYWLPSVLHMWDPVPIPQPPPPPPQPNTNVVFTEGRRLTPLGTNQYRAALEMMCREATEMARKLELPIPLPIRPSDVRKTDFGFWNGDFSGQIFLHSNHRFNFRHGRMTGVAAPDSESHLSTPDFPNPKLEQLTGTIRFTPQQVLEFARKKVRTLGYPDDALFLDRSEPKVRLPPVGTTNAYTRVPVRWDNGVFSMPGSLPDERVIVEVDASTLELKAIGVMSSRLRRPSPFRPEPRPE